MGFYSLDALGRDAKRNEVEIRLPDVNASDVWCTVEERGKGRLTAGEGGREAEERGKGRLKAGEGGRGADSVRVGLAFIRDWSEETATAVVTECARRGPFRSVGDFVRRAPPKLKRNAIEHLVWRSEEHTSELQSRLHLVCRLLLEKKKKNIYASP